tara:strand:- start:1 stop:159 length:159 start_codon:yes stop_codon:yes gene_type:complete
MINYLELGPFYLIEELLKNPLHSGKATDVVERISETNIWRNISSKVMKLFGG